MTVKDLDYYILQPSNASTSGEWNNDSLLHFQEKVMPKALGTQLFTDYKKVYRYVKFNSFSYYISAFAIPFDYPITVGTSKTPYSAGIYDALKNFPFYISWNLDTSDCTTFNDKGKCTVNQPSIATVTSNPKTKTIYIGTKKAASFKYVVPSHVRKYIDTTSVETDLDKDVGEFLASSTNLSNFRAPNRFNGTITEIFSKVAAATVSGKFPVQIVLIIKNFANVTFKGRDMT